MLRTGRLHHLLHEVLSLRFDAGISPDAGSRATGDPGVSPGRTRTRLTSVSLSLGYAADLLSLWRPNYWTHVGRGNQGSLLPSACTLWDAFIEFTGVTSTFPGPRK